MNILNLILIFILFNSCNGGDANFSIPKDFTDTSVTFKKEIPTYKDGPRYGDTSFLFTAIRQDASQLGLDIIEDGFDSLQIRVWLGHSLAIKRNVVILKKVDKHWQGQLVTFSYEEDEKTRKTFISRKEIKKMSPKSGWKGFLKKISDLQILTLPHGPDIKGYNSCGAADGIDYFFEIASSNRYRFYYYCNPDENLSQFWQVKHILEFSNLLEQEFDFKYIK